MEIQQCRKTDKVRCAFKHGQKQNIFETDLSANVQLELYSNVQNVQSTV